MEKTTTPEQPKAETPVAVKPSETKKGKMSKKAWILIGCGAAVVIAIIVAIILIVNKGSNEVTCTMEQSMFGTKADAEIKISFNKDGYAVRTDSKISADMGNNATDTMYESFVKSISYSYYSKNKGNLSNNLELGHTSLGDDTKIERNGSNIVVTATRTEGKGEEATQAEIDASIKMAEATGYTCNR